MKSSKDLLREINYELTLPSSRGSPPRREQEFRKSTSQQNMMSNSQGMRKSISPFRRNNEVQEASRSEIIADQLIQKIALGKEKFSQSCKGLLSQINQILDEDRSYIHVEE
ncbi:unnamed protein product [Blepharisma stoltei]|uniref:Uncharacterized protein n=1 Tax=Blepharisma stoltei TaxID=1481888 RepID=A0AAU9K698_9CILI|nr:unnamed protein product [Blepharisma stoltei]